MARNRSRRNKSLRRNKRSSRRNRRGGAEAHRNNLVNYLNSLDTEGDLREKIIRACAIIEYMTANPSQALTDDLLALRTAHGITAADIRAKNEELDASEDEDRYNRYDEEANVLVRAYNGEEIPGAVTASS